MKKDTVYIVVKCIKHYGEGLQIVGTYYNKADAEKVAYGPNATEFRNIIELKVK